MIVSYSQNFIFIKTRKTAGTSLEIALSRLCNHSDIVTPLSSPLNELRDEESLRRREGGHPPCNWAVPFRPHKIDHWRHLLRNRRRKPLFKPHTTAVDIKTAIGDDAWHRSFKFSIERNPWDRAVSRYWWQKFHWERKRDTPFMTISECLRLYATETPKWLTNWNHYTIDDEVVVDKMLFYESLDEDLDDLKREMGIKGNISLPSERAKGQHRHDKRHYSEILSDEDRELISWVCRHEIEIFGYVFEDMR